MSPRALTAAPDDRSMWRRALAKLHPDGGGTHDLFVWAGAVRDVVCDSSLRSERSAEAGANPEPSDHPSRRREPSTSEEPARVPYPPDETADFAALTARALEYGGEFAPVLNLLRDCWPAEGRAHEQGRGATYKRLAAIGHAFGMTKAERVRWYRVAESIPLSDRHAGDILAWSKRSAA